MADRLRDEVALVTGSTAGIGRAIAIEFAAQGAAVCVTGRDEERGRATCDAIRGAGGRATFLVADLTDESQVRTLVADAARAFDGRLTVLVNNAAHAGGASIESVTTNDWNASFLVNVTAAMWTIREAVPFMQRAGHGSIINISTRQAERVSAGFAAYAASKSALNGLTRASAVDLAPYSIRCNTISPGYVVNDARDRDTDSDTRARREAMHLTRLGTAHDVAHAAVYLASNESEFLTGINLQLDGGSSIARGAVLG